MRYKFLHSLDHLAAQELKAWLIWEDETIHSGFYCNWKIIQKSINTNEAYGITASNQIIGILTWHEFEGVVSINIMEIHPKWRSKGAGRFLIEKAIEDFRKKGFMVAHLQCNPAESAGFWKKLEFMEFPSVDPNLSDTFQQEDTCLYKSLQEAAHNSSGILSSELIELWDKDAGLVRDDPPRWTWIPAYDVNSVRLQKPIIHPCKGDWKIRWIKDNTILFEDKAKRFLGGEPYKGDFLVIHFLDK